METFLNSVAPGEREYLRELYAMKPQLDRPPRLVKPARQRAPRAVKNDRAAAAEKEKKPKVLKPVCARGGVKFKSLKRLKRS